MSFSAKIAEQVTRVLSQYVSQHPPLAQDAELGVLRDSHSLHDGRPARDLRGEGRR